MATRTYHGSCHCKRIQFEAELDLSAGTGKCDCSYCWKVRNWSIGIKPPAFRLTAGKEHVSEYGFSPESTNHHVFCGHCGVRLYTHGFVAELGGAYVSIALAALDDLSPEELAAAPTTFMNGRDNDWFHTPTFTAHL